MLDVARASGREVRATGRASPGCAARRPRPAVRAAAFDLVVSFGAFGHFLPRELPGLFAQVHSVLRPGGRFAFPVVRARPGRRPRAYWMLLGFDAVMRVRNAVWRPPFVMYYRAFRLGDVRRELERAGSGWTCTPCPSSGDGATAVRGCRMVVARRAD